MWPTEHGGYIASGTSRCPSSSPSASSRRQGSSHEGGPDVAPVQSSQTHARHPLAGTIGKAGAWVHGALHRCIAGAWSKTWDTHGRPTQAGQDRPGTRPRA